MNNVGSMIKLYPVVRRSIQHMIIVKPVSTVPQQI